MKYIVVSILLVLTSVGVAFGFDWPLFISKSPSEQEVIRLLGKPSKAGTLYDQVDYETFTKINKLDIYMLEYDKPFQSPLDIDATSFMVWLAKPGSYLNKEGTVEGVFSVDFFFSGRDKHNAYAALKFDKKCINENSACFFVQKCWKVTISPSKEYKNYYYVFAQKYVDGTTYEFSCSKATSMGMDCLDDEVCLTLRHFEALDIAKLKKECEQSKKGAKK